MTRGLPPIDVPFHLQEPLSCKRCKHSFYHASDTELRYLRCGRSQYSIQCRYERHETGECGPAAIHFNARGVS